MSRAMCALPWTEMCARVWEEWIFLDTNLLRLPALGQLAVLEVKYDEFLPDLVRMAVQIPGRQASACSKYAVCRRYD